MSFSKYNPALLCDFYEFTMGNGYFETGKKDDIACFDLFFRRVPDNGGFAIAAGLLTLLIIFLLMTRILNT